MQLVHLSPGSLKPLREAYRGLRENLDEDDGGHLRELLDAPHSCMYLVVGVDEVHRSAFVPKAQLSSLMLFGREIVAPMLMLCTFR